MILKIGRLLICLFKFFVFEQVEQFKYAKVQSAKFFFKDGDATLYHVKEYFNF